MDNRFYGAFDLEYYEKARTTDYRTPFQVDRDRILYTTAFRRLQNKTQVFLAGEFDFYRTRLTHSLEVAQIGRSICRYLLHRGEILEPDFYVDADLVEAISLTHDLGHPPFGHAGERSLNLLMKDYGGFEGNAQSLRIITETIYSTADWPHGMNPTRAFLDGILKYKTFYGELDDPDNHFLYDEQEKYLIFAFGGEKFRELAPGSERNGFRSLECQIMDWADDSSYSINDIVDGVRAGFITPDHVERWAENANLNNAENAHIENLLKAIREDDVEARFGRKIGEFIKGCRLIQRPENLLSTETNRYRFSLKIDESVREEADLYSRLASEIVFMSPPLQHLQYKGNFFLKRMFDTLVDSYLERDRKQLIDFLPPKLSKHLKETKTKRDRMRLLCDFLAGMTDNYAVRFYKRLFSPDFAILKDEL